MSGMPPVPGGDGGSGAAAAAADEVNSVLDMYLIGETAEGGEEEDADEQEGSGVAAAVTFAPPNGDVHAREQEQATGPGAATTVAAEQPDAKRQRVET